MTGIVTSGTVAFSNIDQMEEYKGQSTGRYSITLTLDAEEAQKLEDLGLKLRDYQGTPQRKFTSKFKVGVVDTDNNPVAGEIPWGSKVRVLWRAGDPHPEHGIPAYVNKVRVVEFAEHDGEDDPSEF